MNLIMIFIITCLIAALTVLLIISLGRKSSPDHEPDVEKQHAGRNGQISYDMEVSEESARFSLAEQVTPFTTVPNLPAEEKQHAGRNEQISYDMEVSEELARFSLAEQVTPFTTVPNLPAEEKQDTGVDGLTALSPSAGQSSPTTRQDYHTPPVSYDEDRIVALVRDPYCIFTYWDISHARREELQRRLGDRVWEDARLVLRLYDTTNLYFYDSERVLEIPISDLATNWYLHTGIANHTFFIELGMLHPGGTYTLLSRSNLVSTPRSGISEIIDEKWLLPGDRGQKLYQHYQPEKVSSGTVMNW
jgi:hypothetical protein